MDQWEVKMKNPDGMIGVNIIIFRMVGNRGYEILNNDGTVSLVGYGEAPKAPTIYLDPGMYDALVLAITKKHKGVNSSFVEGQVEAMKLHLEDMRDIVFKDFPVKITGVDSKITGI